MTRVILFLLVISQLSFFKDAHADEPASNDLRIFEIGFDLKRDALNDKWIPIGILIHESGVKAKPAGPFKTAAAFRAWIKSMPPSSILRYGAGCVAIDALPVDRESIKIQEIRRLCKAGKIQFDLTVGW